MAAHTPRRDMTLVCSSDSMVHTSLASRSISLLEKSAETHNSEESCFKNSEESFA